MRDRRHIIISGPSGCGKSTILKRLVASNPLFIHSISHTTREKRIGEKEGVDYFFVDKQMFIEKIYNNDFVEYAIYNNQYYGTSISQFENQKKILILDLEKQGVETLLESKFDFRYIYVSCTKHEQMNRLLNRCRDEVMPIRLFKDIDARMSEYDKDVKAKNRFKYDLVVENRNLNKCIAEIEEFLYQHEEIKRDNKDVIYRLEDLPPE